MTAEAELLANLPADGVRVWRLLTPKLHLIATLGDSAWESREGDERWFKRATFVPNPHWTEITPALPDPSGDLPDGTLVRIVFEGPVKNWKRGRGSLETSGRGQLYFGLRDTDGATVEVLALPTPSRPDPLDGKPGSLWRDPETGGIYYRTANGKTSQGRPLLVLIEGNWNHDGWVLTAPNTEVVARLVPTEEGEQ